MPIEIRELHIKAVVKEEEGTSQNSPDSGQSLSPKERNAVVAEAVEQVLEILSSQKER